MWYDDGMKAEAFARSLAERPENLRSRMRAIGRKDRLFGGGKEQLMKYHRLVLYDGNVINMRLAPKADHVQLIRAGVDAFSHEAGIHNGPECADCGKTACWHCDDWHLRKECIG